MGIDEHITELNGYSIREYDSKLPLIETDRTVYRISEYPISSSSQDAFSDFSALVGCLSPVACVIAGVASGIAVGNFFTGLLVCVAGCAVAWGAIFVILQVRVRLRRGWYCPYCQARLTQRWNKQCEECEHDWEKRRSDTDTDDRITSRLRDLGTIGKQLAEYVADPNANKSLGLIISACAETAESSPSDNPHIEALCLASERLQQLEILFIGEMTVDEMEISWMSHGDLSAVIKAYPNLKHLWIRGAEFSLEPISSPILETLVLESGGLKMDVVRSVIQSQLPNLEQLEIWTGSEEFGAEATVFEFRPLFDKPLFPKLTHLAVRNCEFSDEFAESLSETSWLKQLKILDLSLGTLSYRGAVALLKTPWLSQLEFLDIHHHFMTPELVQQLQATGVMLNADDPQIEEADISDDGEIHRYCAVGE